MLTGGAGDGRYTFRSLLWLMVQMAGRLYAFIVQVLIARRSSAYRHKIEIAKAMFTDMTQTSYLEDMASVFEGTTVGKADFAWLKHVQAKQQPPEQIDESWCQNGCTSFKTCYSSVGRECQHCPMCKCAANYTLSLAGVQQQCTHASTCDYWPQVSTIAEEKPMVDICKVVCSQSQLCKRVEVLKKEGFLVDKCAKRVVEELEKTSPYYEVVPLAQNDDHDFYNSVRWALSQYHKEVYQRYRTVHVLRHAAAKRIEEHMQQDLVAWFSDNKSLQEEYLNGVRGHIEEHTGRPVGRLADTLVVTAIAAQLGISIELFDFGYNGDLTSKPFGQEPAPFFRWFDKFGGAFEKWVVAQFKAYQNEHHRLTQRQFQAMVKALPDNSFEGMFYTNLLDWDLLGHNHSIAVIRQNPAIIPALWDVINSKDLQTIDMKQFLDFTLRNAQIWSRVKQYQQGQQPIQVLLCGGHYVPLWGPTNQPPRYMGQ